MKTPFGQALREALLKELSTLPASCGALSATQLGEVVMAGDLEGGRTDDAVVVFFDPALQERAVLPCAKELMKSKGGELKTKRVAGRTAHYAAGTADDNGWVAWTKAGVPILAGGEAWLAATLDPKAAKIAPGIADLARRADHGRMIWAAAELSLAQVRAWGLPEDVLRAGSVGVRVGVDLGDEIDLDAVISATSEDDARRVAVLLRAQIDQLRASPAALFLSNVRLGLHGAEVRVMVHLDAAATAAIHGMLKP